MANAMQDAILNGLYDSSYPGSETLGPSILSNKKKKKNLVNFEKRII